MKPYTKIICLDFDGVIHSYTSGWMGPRCIPDPPVPGVLEWMQSFIVLHCTVPDSISCCAATPGDYRLCVYSSRSRYWLARRAMKRWMVRNGFDRRFFEVLEFPTRKPAAYVTIDDRAICFKGAMPEFDDIANFRAWNKKA